MGCALCLFYLSIEQDPKIQLDQTLDRCITALSFTRLLMNLALKDDRWSWLVYNGTIYLYKMSRYLMTLGYSIQVRKDTFNFSNYTLFSVVFKGCRISRLGCCQYGNVLTIIIHSIFTMAIDTLLCCM
jgi:hypothetical protein